MAMRFALDQAVKVDPRFERQMALGELALDRSFQRMVCAGRLFCRCRRNLRIGGGCRGSRLFGACGFLSLRLRRQNLVESLNIVHAPRQGPGGARDLAPEDAVVRAELRSWFAV